MRPRSLIAAVLAGLGLSACGSTNASDSTPPAPGVVTSASVTTAAPAVSTTAVEPTATTATVPTTTTTPASATATAPDTVTTATITRPSSGGAGFPTVTTATSACVGSDLSASAVPPNSAPGTTVLGFILKNTSSSSCHTDGWPGIAFVNTAGSVVATLTTRSTHDVLGSTPPTAFVIPAGSEASFRVTVHDAGGGTQASCASYSRLQIIVPNDTAATVVSIPDGPVQSCGNVAVSAVEPGLGATGQ